MEAGMIRFDPVVITDVATEMGGEIAAMCDAIEGIRQRNESLKGDWKGDSGEEYFSQCKKLDEQAEKLLDQLRLLSQNMTDAARIYQKTEDANTQQNQSLPTEGVFIV